jgi:predicted ATP-grasp superfamily ATP-dependent carboligase
LSRPFDPWRVPDFADIPDAGSAVEAGQPVLTFFATGNTPAAVRRELQSRAAELDSLFAEHTP